MDADVLRMALQFGNGTHLTEETQEGMGKFGMGLPSSSISQCRHVEVWTWQAGPESAIYSYLDLDRIISGDMDEERQAVERHDCFLPSCTPRLYVQG